MKFFCLAFASAILYQTTIAQTSFKIESFGPVPEDFSYLLLPNNSIANNDTINERVLDLVQPQLADSVIERRIQHHKLGPLGWFISTFAGFNWRAASMKKEKMVGTVYRHARSGEEEFTEYDINFDLRFHLKKYLWRVFDLYDLAKKYRKQDVRPSHRTNYDTIPYIRDTNYININNYRLHCELTPPAAFRAPLNYLFFPTQPGYGGLQEHLNFGTNRPSMGFYGVLCSDCNHNCGAEMHPYEWVWWLKADSGDATNKRTWFTGLFHEGSNRMKKWSVNPMDGLIKIPFAIQTTSSNDTVLQIQINPLVFSKLIEPSNQYEDEEAFIFSGKTTQVTRLEAGDRTFFVHIHYDHAIRTKAIRYFFSDLNFDKTSGVVSGYFNMALRINDVYTTKITFN